jgi:leucyl aminopeptidase
VKGANYFYKKTKFRIYDTITWYCIKKQQQGAIMPLPQWKKIALCMGTILSSASIAASMMPSFEQIQVPLCLATKLPASYQVLAENNRFKIINVPSIELDNVHLLADEVGCGYFVNVTGQLNTQSPAQLLEKAPVRTLNVNKGYEILHEDAVNAALAKVVPDNIWNTLTHLTSYQNRSATTTTGVATAKWLRDQFETMANDFGRTDTATYFVKTGKYYIQPSLVTVIGKDLTTPGIVIGAHMDTLDGRMPGAGDDGSGTSSVMEMARVLLASKMEFKRPIYIIWYAAEERGLVGSQYVVKDFMQKSIPVKAAIQFDMTGFRNDAEDETMWVFRDYTDKSLSNYIAKLIKHYVKVPVNYSSCGYGCSDHASWDEEGIPVAFPCETNFEDHNPYIHTSSDTMDRLSLDHMTNFAKLALAFAIELAME